MRGMGLSALNYRCADAYRRIPHGRRGQDGSRETSRSLKLKDCTTAARLTREQQHLLKIETEFPLG
jgi:hypothetical protein